MITIPQIVIRVVLRLLQISTVVCVYSGLFIGGAVLLRRITTFDEDEASQRTKMALYGGIIGGIAFATVNPLVTPIIYDMQEGIGMIQEPRPEFHLNVANLTPPDARVYGVDYEHDRQVYTLVVSNPHQQTIDDLTLVLGFNDCSIEAGISPRQYTRGPVVGLIPKLEIRSDPPGEEVERCYESIYFHELSANDQVALYFVTDANTGANVNIGESGPMEDKEVVIDYGYDWSFNGREYDEAFRETVIDTNLNR